MGSLPLHKDPRYLAYLRSPTWEKHRIACLKRAQFKCLICGRKDKALDAHHCSYENLYHEGPNDLVALCRACHDAVHTGTLESPMPVAGPAYAKRPAPPDPEQDFKPKKRKRRKRKKPPAFPVRTKRPPQERGVVPGWQKPDA